MVCIIDAVDSSWSNFALVRLNAFSFGVTGLILAMDTVVLPVIVLTIAPESLKNTYLAALGVSGLIIAALMQPLIGRISDQFRSPLGRRAPFIIWGTVAVCASLAGIWLAPNFLALFVVWVFIQGNINFIYGPGQALIRDLVPLHRIGVASSLKILLDSAGGLCLIAVTGTLITRDAGNGFVDWRWLALAVLGTSLLVSSAVTCYTVLARDRSIPLPRRVRGAEPPKSVWNSQMGFFLVSRLMMMTSVSSFYTYGLFFLRDVVEVSDPAQTLARMILAIGGALGVMVYLSGRISDQVGRKPVVVAGATGAALSTVWMLTAGDPTEVLLTATVIGASVGALLSANWAMANELADPEQAGLHIGIVNLSTIGGAGIAKLLGPGIDLLNHISEDFGYRALIAGCAALFLAGAAMLLPVKSERAMPPTPSG